ncbi:MAG TPA: hypothetical protein PKW92_12240, partial [Smithella sp.]|nr:hypothetical protein [Smithella sp.]
GKNIPHILQPIKSNVLSIKAVFMAIAWQLVGVRLRPFFMAARNSDNEMLFGKYAEEHLFGNALLTHKKAGVL